MAVCKSEGNPVSKSFHHNFLNKNDFLARHTHCLVCDSNQFTNRLCGVKCPKIRQDKILSNVENS